jgi:hypothetical protein
MGHDTFTAMNEYINFIAKRQKVESENDFKKHKFSFDLMRHTTTSPLLLQKTRQEIKRSNVGSFPHMLVLEEPEMEICEV